MEVTFGAIRREWEREGGYATQIEGGDEIEAKLRPSLRQAITTFAGRRVLQPRLGTI
jgi:hypothetical protein